MNKHGTEAPTLQQGCTGIHGKFLLANPILGSAGQVHSGNGVVRRRGIHCGLISTGCRLHSPGVRRLKGGGQTNHLAPASSGIDFLISVSLIDTVHPAWREVGQMSSAAMRLYQNRLLTELAPTDLDRLRAALRPVELHRGDVLTVAGAPPEHLYFIERGVAAVQGETGPAVDLIGRSGAVGLEALFTPGSGAAGRATVLVSGEAYRLTAQALRASVSRLPGLNEILMLALQCWVLRLTQSAICHARHALEARTARWLLMLRDELESDELPVTHEFLAEALGVRRAGVTGAMVSFQQTGLLKQGRAHVRITDPAGLERSACPCHARLLAAQATAWAAHSQHDPAVVPTASIRSGDVIRVSLKQRVEARVGQPGANGRFGAAAQVCRDVIRHCETVLPRA